MLTMMFDMFLQEHLGVKGSKIPPAFQRTVFEVKSGIFKKIPLISTLSHFFLTINTENTVLSEMWQTMLLLSYFNPLEESYLIHLHSNPKNNEFLKKLVRFHIYNVEKQMGSRMWQNTAFNSLTDHLAARSIPTRYSGLCHYYQYYDRLINRQ